MNELLRKIGEANVELERAKHATLEARDREVQVLNNLNQLQREFDDQVTKFREASPADSDWGMERKRK